MYVQRTLTPGRCTLREALFLRTSSCVTARHDVGNGWPRVEVLSRWTMKNAMDWIFVALPKFILKAQTPVWWYLEVGVSGRWLLREGGALGIRLLPFTKDRRASSLSFFPYSTFISPSRHMRTGVKPIIVSQPRYSYLVFISLKKKIQLSVIRVPTVLPWW